MIFFQRVLYDQSFPFANNYSDLIADNLQVMLDWYPLVHQRHNIIPQDCLLTLSSESIFCSVKRKESFWVPRVLLPNSAPVIRPIVELRPFFPPFKIIDVLLKSKPVLLTGASAARIPL